MNEELGDLKKRMAAHNLSLLDYTISIIDKKICLTSQTSERYPASVEADFEGMGFTQSFSDADSGGTRLFIMGENDVRLAVDNGILSDDLEVLCQDALFVMYKDPSMEATPTAGEFNRHNTL